MDTSGAVLYSKVEPQQTQSSSLGTPTRLNNGQQPLERVVVCPHCEFRTLNVWSWCGYGRHYGITVSLRRGIDTLREVEGVRPAPHRPSRLLLLQFKQCCSQLVRPGVGVNKIELICSWQRENGGCNQIHPKRFERTSFFFCRAVPVRMAILARQIAQLRRTLIGSLHETFVDGADSQKRISAV